AGGDTSWVGNPTAAAGFAGFQAGTNASNSADGTVTCGPGSPAAGYAIGSNVSSVHALDLLGNRYLNLRQCNWRSAAGGDASWVGNTTATAGFAGFQTGTNASNSADGTVTCGPGNPAAGYAIGSNVSSVHGSEQHATRHHYRHQLICRPAAGGDTSWVANTTA